MTMLRERPGPTADRPAAWPAARGSDRQRHDQALLRRRQRMRRSDLEFLPAALEILETPPSPVRLAIMTLLMAMTAAALAWSYVGRVDVVAIAQGKIQAIGRTKVVQPLESGRVKAVHVANGQAVRAGEILLELDASVSEADEWTLSTSLAAFDAEAQRRRTALATIGVGVPPAGTTIAWPDGVPAAVAAREQRVLDNDIAQLAATLASLSASAREKTAERERLLRTIAAEERLIAILHERVSMRSTLLDRSVGSRSGVMDALETLETQQTYLANLQGQAAQTGAAIETVRTEIEKSYRAFILDNAQRLADAERQAEEARTRLDKARLVTAHAILRSPIDGIAQGLSVVSPGQVVQTGEQVVEIVPATGLEVEAYLPNTDSGFVAAGQPAIVKVEAFPFTRYGMLDGVVTRVAADALPDADARQREENPVRSGATLGLRGSQRVQNLVFPMSVTLAGALVGADGQPIRLTPGMAVTVEVKTGSRRIIEYLLSPLTEISSRSLRER